MDPTSKNEIEIDAEVENGQQQDMVEEFVIDEDQDIENDGMNEELEELEIPEEGETKKELVITQRPKISIKSDKLKSEKYVSTQKKYKKFEGNPQEQLYLISEKLLTMSPTQNSVYEMEAKFGTRGIKQITKIDYDNVIKKLKSLNFTCENENGDYSLKIQPEAIYRGELSVAGNFDLFRVEINGLLNIQEYCKTNNIKSLNQKSSGSIVILQKYDVKEENDSMEENFIFELKKLNS